MRSLAVLVSVAATLVASSEACTTVAINGEATVDGVSVTVHTTDCEVCDPRLALVPGRDHEEGAMHDIYGVADIYPRMHGDRAVIYENVTGEARVYRQIPEVAHTYGVWEATYSMINEHGLSFGESSCGSKVGNAGVDTADPKTGKFGEAYFSIAALMRLGLERCKTAVCAIKTMGALAEEHGFYGEGYDEGEALSIADPSGDAWIFHIVQDISTHKSAIWAAQRVPPGHLAVVANEFTIKAIPEGEHPDFMHSANMRDEAKKAGYYSGEGEFSFQKVFGMEKTMRSDLYATLRQHWIYSRVAPSLNLELKEAPVDMPFSVPVDRKLNLTEIMHLYQHFYEGTEWDMTEGILAGPFGNPKRVEGGAISKFGQFARGISIPRTTHTHLGYASATKGATFFSVDEPASGVFAPFLTATLREAATVELHETANFYASAYQLNRRDQFSRESAWWAFDIVANWMNINYRNMSQEFVRPAMAKWQARAMEAFEKGTTTATRQFQEDLVSAWWGLFDLLIVRYNDGTFNYFPGHSPKNPAQRYGYPAAWLRDIGLDSTFWKAHSVQDIVHGACSHDHPDKGRGFPVTVFVITAIVCVAAGVLIGRRSHRVSPGGSNTQPLLNTNEEP
ncbi:Dipeptidase A [Hondaea fermentalgiana]|uniref:Dipeptidase A n=1 Tax=Hondaea fermentalgiana TaxID=2315210 RepID=A0A2R5GJZ5_9STRA|nr:Dipeptidase A [Hondaea fermentalgiana]|eukprot:GBG31226.1 Dipeptidase A [Hondaea fermentalgiana]